LMLLRVAKEFGFKVRTFQHVLEGYKVAETKSPPPARAPPPSPIGGLTRSKPMTPFRTTPH